MCAHRILRKMAEIRKATDLATWLRPDCKSQVALKYTDGKMTGIENVDLSTNMRPMQKTKQFVPSLLRKS